MGKEKKAERGAVKDLLKYLYVLVRQDSFTDLVTVAAWAAGAPSTAKLVARPATSVAAANFVNRWFLGMPSL